MSKRTVYDQAQHGFHLARNTHIPPVQTVTGLAVLIPAAGRAARMQGRDKLLERVDGMPLLRRQVLLGLATRLPVLVTLPTDRPARQAAIEGLEGVETKRLPDAGEGIAASIRAGAHWAAAREARGLMILLADLPDLQGDDLKKMIHTAEKEPETTIRAYDASGKPGHPVILPARLFGRLEKLRGDEGAKPVLTGERIAKVALPGRRATTDLDTPEDWAAWREKSGQQPF